MLANALRILFSFKRPPRRDPGLVRPVGGGDHPSPKSLTPDLIKKLEEGDEDALRYPPYIRGYPAFIAGHVLLDYHKEKVGQIASGIGLPPQQFKRLILPALVSYANFVHLVPASQNHHHRAWGGLLAHGLEVALLALNSCQVTSFDHGRVPQERTRRKERWYAAAVFASLLHDTGKPLSDFRVTDASGELFWKPVSKSIPDWAAENGIERYYLHWNPGRHERHKNLSITMVDRILHPEVREWLMDGGQDLYSAMVAAITGDDEKSALTGIVIKADSASVHLDLKKRGGDPAGTAAGGTGVPIASHVIGAMRLLRQNEIWKANGRGDRIWSTTQGIFIAWNSAAAEVVEKMLADGLKAFPRSADSLGEILADHDVFERNPNGSIYWKVAPDILSEGKEKILRLQCIKLSSPSTLYPYDPAPPPVAVIIGDEKDGIRYDPVNGVMGVPVGVNAQAGALKGVELAGVEHPVATDGDLKPMFDLEGASDTPASKGIGGKNSGAFSEPTLLATPGAAEKTTAAPAVALDATSSKKQGLVIGAPPPAASTKKGPSLPNSDLFAGVKVGVSVPALEDEALPVEQAPVQADPFATSLAGDFFGVEPAAQTQPKQADSPKSPAGSGYAKEKELKLAGRDHDPGARDPNESQRSKPSTPALQIGAKPLASAVTTATKNQPQQPIQQMAGERFETIDITSDFDPEILEFTGIERAFGDVPVKVEQSAHEDTSPSQTDGRSQSGHASSLNQDNRRGPSLKGSLVAPPIGDFDDAFRFDAEHSVLEEFDVPDLPGDNPLGISAPPEFADIDVSSFCVQEAPKPVSLEGFDLPALESHVFVGGAPAQPIVQMGGLEELEYGVASEDGEANESQMTAGELLPVSTAGATKKKRRRKKRHALSVESMPESDLGQPLLSGSVARIHIGPVRKSQAQSERPHVEVPRLDTTPALAAEAEVVADELPPTDYLAFLNRHPPLAEKFLWYTRHVDQGLRLYKRHQALFIFQEGGFQAEDEDALNEAHWLWFDITAPGRTVFGNSAGEKGFVLNPYLVDALAALCEGRFQIAVNRPPTDLSMPELTRLARAALEGAPVNTRTYGVPVVVFTPMQLRAVASEQGVRESDLIRALIETQQTSLDRKNYVIRVDAKAVSYE
ncbi:MobH family relaxase [Pseudomonas asiatica]|uniref:MobH family relaxase n=1 Tax=Pseudomonas asiatica TaxID=2219225 RepID=UPI00345C8ABC